MNWHVFWKKRLLNLICGLILFSSLCFLALAESHPNYHSPQEVASLLKNWASQKPDLCRLLVLGKSAGQAEIDGIEIAAERQKLKPEDRPAVLITANLEGWHLPGTEAALKIAQTIIDAYAKDSRRAEFLKTHTIYVFPLLNPDAAAAYFSKPKFERDFNARPVDEDNDGLVDEDGPEDLNGDGYITLMRIKSPEGKWIVDPKNPKLMRLADFRKGEKGEYLVYTEGLDNDGDGQFNEDGPGGVCLNRNFAHDFEYFEKKAGLYPASEPEAEALLRFMFDRQNIALVINFSTENNLLNMQQTGQARVGSDRVRVPRQFATFLGLDPETEYTLKEIIEAVKASGLGGGMEIDEGMIASFLGLGPAMTIDRSDQVIYDEIQKEYKQSLKQFGLDYLEKRARGVGKGSFTAFCYYQYGVPVFSFDLWQVPEPKKEEKKDSLTAEKLKSMSSEEFLALGEEKIAAFLKEQGVPPNFSASMLINMVKSGQVTPARMADMMEKMPRAGAGANEEHPEAYLLAYSDSVLKGAGFIDWKPFRHPQLGEIEIGGFVPYLKLVPPPEQLENSLKVHADFCLKLMEKLPWLVIREHRLEKIGPETYRLSLYLQNAGAWPTSTAQGRRALTAYPLRARLMLEPGQKLFAGKPVENLNFLQAGETKKLEWTIQGKKGSSVKVKIWGNRINPLDFSLKLD
ncbi:MAG: M14 family metallopeptidase [Candidatus Saccharicenans sp.]